MRPMQRRIRRTIKKGACFFCLKKIEPDLKDLETLKHYVSERGKIESRLQSSVCHKHQRIVATLIKRARFLALLPFIVRPV